MNPHVCGDCFRDESIKQFVYDNAVSDQCDFCGRRKDSPVAAPWNAVLAFIREGLEFYWTTDVDDLPIEPFDDEGRRMIHSYDTEQLLKGDGMIADDTPVLAPIANEAVLQALEQSMPDDWYDRYMTEEEPYGKLILQWPDFVYRVERKSRFFFFTPMKGDSETFEPAQFPTVRLLDELGDLVRKTNLVKIVPARARFFRARQHRLEVPVETASELGPPAHSVAFSSNRMSPAGIVMFYGAYDGQTAKREVCDQGRASVERETELTIGQFETLADIKAIDLTELPPCPSIFDRDNRIMISGIRFLHRFVENLKRSVRKDGKEHLEYVPTQVITEYFRHGFADTEQSAVQGILYPSSIEKAGICCVLFFEADQCGGEPLNPFNSQRRQQWLRLKTDSVEHSKVEKLI